jgi:uncharacterized protein
MLERLPAQLSAAAIRHPRRTLGVFLALVLAAAPGLVRLKLRTDGHALVPPRDPAVLFDAEVRQHFGLRDPIALIVETTHPDGIFNLTTLTKVRDLSARLALLPEIGERHVASLATEHRDRVRPGTLEFLPFLEPLPETPEQMATLVGDVDAARILDGTLISLDRKAAAILVGSPSADGGAFDRTALVARIQEIAAPFEGGGDHVAIVGAPVAEALLGQHVIEDLALLLPLALAVIATVLWLGTRRLACLALAGAEVMACLLFTFGCMGWAGQPVYLTTAILPVILTTVILADEIHVFWRYQRALLEQETGPHPAALQHTMAELARPVCLTSLTTAVGFLSFLGSTISAVRFLGLFAALGITFSMFWTLAAVPAVLAWMGPGPLRRPQSRAGDAQGWIGRGEWVVRLLSPLLSRPKQVLAAVCLLTVLLGLGVFRLDIQDSWIDGFAERSAFRRATERTNREFFGTHLLLVHLRFPSTGGERGPLASPDNLRAIGELEEFLRRQPGVGGVLGPESQFKTVAYLWLGRREELRAIPDTEYMVERLVSRFDMGRGEHRRRELVDDALERAVVTVFLKDANYRDTAELMHAVRAHAAQTLAPRGVEVDFAGDVAVSQAMIPAIVTTQVSSVVLAPLSCLAVIALLYRSLKTGFLAVLPASLAVAWVLGAMGWLGIPLGVATSMFCAITLGVAVDYAIHFLERYRDFEGQGDPRPVERALAETAPPITSDVVAISLGFGILAFSQVPANARLGLLVAFALVAGGVLTLAGLGSLLALAGGKGGGRGPAGEVG